MLIEFRFKNYRSFRDEATLSMEATGLGPSKELDFIWFVELITERCYIWKKWWR